MSLKRLRTLQQIAWLLSVVLVEDYPRTWASLSYRSVRRKLRAPANWLVKMDDWRYKRPDMPGHAKAIRCLVEKAL